MTFTLRSSFVPRLRGLWGTSLFLSLAACTTGQTGGEVEFSREHGEDDLSGSGDRCEELSSTSLELDEETAIGVSAQQLMDAISGVHETTLSWGEDLENSFFELTPNASQSMITVEVIPHPESAVFVDRAVEQSSSDDDRALIGEIDGEACADEVRVEAEVIITSENGAFEDSFEAIFSTQNGTIASTRIEMVPGELDGDFDVAAEGNGEPVQTAMDLYFAFGTMSGSVSGIWQEVHGDPGDQNSVVSGTPMTYARFPADGCQWGILVTEESPFGAAIVDAVGEASAFELEWQAGDATALSVDTTIGKMCLEANSYESGATIVADGVSVVLSEDGRVDATWDVEVRAWLEADAVTSLTVTSVEGDYEGYGAAEFAAASGISGIETDATDMAFEFTYSPGLGSEAASGTLTVFELSIPDCARPDYEPEIVETPDGGSSSPGCSGTDYIEIETATFQEAASR